MRIIAGRLKGRRLQQPPPGDLAVRPTSDRAREALFSILEAWPKGAFADLYSGTGAVGLEAWSRGFGPVTCVERDPRASALAQANAAGTEVKVLRADARRLRVDAFTGLAVLFGDPPYAEAAAALAAVAPSLAAWMAPEGLVVWEAAAGAELADPPGWKRFDQRRYGAACFHFWRRR